MAESFACSQTRSVSQGSREVAKTVPVQTHVSPSLLIWTVCLSLVTIVMLFAIFFLAHGREVSSRAKSCQGAKTSMLKDIEKNSDITRRSWLTLNKGSSQ